MDQCGKVEVLNQFTRYSIYVQKDNELSYGQITTRQYGFTAMGYKQMVPQPRNQRDLSHQYQ